MHREGTKWKRWQVMAISTAVVAVTPFLSVIIFLGFVYVWELIIHWPHRQEAPWDTTLFWFGFFTLCFTIPYGFLVSLIAQSAYRAYSLVFLRYLGVMLLAWVVFLILISIFAPASFRHPGEVSWVAFYSGISMLTGALTTYALNARYCQPATYTCSE